MEKTSRNLFIVYIVIIGLILISFSNPGAPGASQTRDNKFVLIDMAENKIKSHTLSRRELTINPQS